MAWTAVGQGALQTRENRTAMIREVAWRTGAVAAVRGDNWSDLKGELPRGSQWGGCTTDALISS